MSNGHNHSTDCACSFCDPKRAVFRSEMQASMNFGTEIRISRSCVLSHTPNANCPECNDPVFFYQNERGSRVFFDELGPPWPKHPCTDSGQFVPFAAKQVDAKSSSACNAGWSVVELLNVTKTSTGQYRFDLKLNASGSIPLFINSYDVEVRANLKLLSNESICFLKQESKGIYSISLLSDDIKILNCKGRDLSNG